MPDDLMTTAAAADKIGISRQHVQRLVKDGLLPAERVGKRLYLIPAAAVAAYAAPQTGRGWRRGRGRNITKRADEVGRVSPDCPSAP
jgi:excisionase family DNA binding protein